MKPHRILPVLLLASTLLAFTPNATAQACTALETFEDDTTFQVPSSCWYTYAANGSPTYVSTALPYEGTKSLLLGTNTDVSFDVSGSTSEVCTGTGSEGSRTYNFAVNIDDVSLSNTDLGNHVYNAVNDVSTGAIRVGTTGATTYLFDGSTAAVTGLTWVSDRWYQVDFFYNCEIGSNNDNGVVEIIDTTTSTLYTAAVTNREIGAPVNGNLFFVEPASNGGNVFIDNFQVSIEFPDVDSRFCANPSEDNFGYEYVEGVSFVDVQPIGISFEDSFLFQGDSGNSEYLAKGYDPGTEAFLVRARLEASGLDGTSSFFRIAFTTGATILDEGAAGDLTTDLAAASNGQDGGNFDDHVQIVLQENGNAWLIAAYYNVGGAGLTQIPGTVNYGANPNSPATFQVVVNSGTTDLPATVENHTISDIGDQSIGIQDGDGSPIFSWPLPSGLYSAEWKDQWFIGKGTGIADSFTYLDDLEQLQDDDSTCVWDLFGTATRTGSAGLVPGSTIIEPPVDDGDDGGFSGLFDPDNIDSQLFIGFLLLAGMVFIGVRQGVGQAAIGALFFVGLFLGYSLGWIPLWVILVIFTASLAAIFVLPRQSKDGV